MLFSEVERGTLAPITPWEDPAWRAEVEAWIRTTLADLGLTAARDGWRARIRRWSVLCRVPLVGTSTATTGEREPEPESEPEPVWFKANPEPSRFEAAISWYLGQHHPEHVLTPLAVDVERGWTLLPHGGQILRDGLAARESASASLSASVEDCIPVVQQYAQFQRAVSTDHVLALGVPHLSVNTLPETIKQIEAAGQSLSATDRALLDARLPDFTTWCHELAATGVPDALDHADLHAGQVFAPTTTTTTTTTRYRFCDWGDAAVTHPFTSMLAPTRAVRRIGANTKDVARLHDAYLEPWTAEYDRAALAEMLTLACRVEAVARILVWNRVFPGNPGGSPGWAAELAEAADY
ncbi:phosphotransferase [Catenulispora yoronensis]|uniref:Phosphotransferase n=1 Tax=Catenulispora yoronensis TaxID=450799 RepID=A0ABN2VCG4_9ACTN